MAGIVASLLRQLVSLSLPVTVLVIVPVWIENDCSPGQGWMYPAGLTVLLMGLVIMAHTIASLIRLGKGTLAPWSPTSRLVTGGLYAYTRNPMILGVLIVPLGEALAFSSWRLLTWAGVFFAVNSAYFVVLEEPGLEKRFGEEYRRYKQNVPRWIPRLRPYDGRSRGD